MGMKYMYIINLATQNVIINIIIPMLCSMHAMPPMYGWTVPIELRLQKKLT